jgi:hypothetical protein
MFTPNQSDVRRFFCQVLRKLQLHEALDPMQTIASEWVLAHPEYHTDLMDEEQAVLTHFPIESGRENPFLHLSMHLSIEEQCTIDQPKGVRAALEKITTRMGDKHLAHHAAMESLGLMIWESQRKGTPPDGHQYLESLNALASKD